MAKAWAEAEAALPPGWELRGVAKGPREVDPRIDSPQWTAWARPGREDADYRAVGRAEGRGETALEALQDLRSALMEVGAQSE